MKLARPALFAVVLVNIFAGIAFSNLFRNLRYYLYNRNLDGMVEARNKILTWHPTGKRGAYIPASDYTLVKNFILSVLKREEISITELIGLAKKELVERLVNDISWSVLVVKLDLEARGLIKSTSRPMLYPNQLLKLRPGALKKLNASGR